MEWISQITFSAVPKLKLKLGRLGPCVVVGGLNAYSDTSPGAGWVARDECTHCTVNCCSDQSTNLQNLS